MSACTTISAVLQTLVACFGLSGRLLCCSAAHADHSEREAALPFRCSPVLRCHASDITACIIEPCSTRHSLQRAVDLALEAARAPGDSVGMQALLPLMSSRRCTWSLRELCLLDPASDPVEQYLPGGQLWNQYLSSRQLVSTWQRKMTGTW